jgi:hypothetical protein
VDSLAVDIKSYWTSWGQQNKRSVRSVKCLIFSSVLIGVHIQLCKERECLIRPVVVLVAFDMFIGHIEVCLSNLYNYHFHEIPIWFQCRGRNGISDLSLFLNLVDEASIVGSEYTTENKSGFGSFSESQEEANDPKHSLGFGSKGLLVMAFNGTGSVG